MAWAAEQRHCLYLFLKDGLLAGLSAAVLRADSLWHCLAAGTSSSSRRRRGQGCSVAPRGLCRGSAETQSWARVGGAPRASGAIYFIKKLLHERNRKCRGK